MLSAQIALPIEEISAYCRTQPIQRLSVFGSVLRQDFSPQSDVDLLVEFVPGARITYFDLYDMQQSLAALIGREVDLLTAQAISPYFADSVRNDAQVIYEAG